MSCYFDEAISIANLNEKSIYIYGASVSGVSLLKYLDKKRIKVTGFFRRTSKFTLEQR